MRDLYLLAFNIKTEFVSDLLFVVKNYGFGLNNESAS